MLWFKFDAAAALCDLLNPLRPAAPDASHRRLVSLPASKASMALRLSLTPAYVSRVRHELDTQGLIAIDKRAIRMLDPQRLANDGSP